MVNTELRDQLQSLVENAGRRRTDRRAATEEEMRVLEERLARAGAVTQKAVREIALPRLQALPAALPNADPPRCDDERGFVCVNFRSTDAYPVGADVSLALVAGPDLKSLMCSWRVSIVPILIDYAREGTLTLDLEAPDFGKLGKFLDNRIVRFVADYLRIHEPGSPYEYAFTVVDPVCGMKLSRANAVQSVGRGGRVHYFCVDECRKRFEAAPEQSGARNAR